MNSGRSDHPKSIKNHWFLQVIVKFAFFFTSRTLRSKIDRFCLLNMGPNWMKLGRNPIELMVLEPLEGVPEPNLDHNGPNKLKLKRKN